MSDPDDDPCRSLTPDELRARFLALLPVIRRTIRFHFRGVQCPDHKDDFVCEAIALCWLWYIRLARTGKDPATFATALARYGAVAVRAGRRACGQESARDVLSPVCQRKRKFAVSGIADGMGATGAGVADALRDNARTPVPDQVQFRVDFLAWAGRLSAAKRKVLDRLARGGRTADVAAEFGLTAGRVSQLRAEFRDGYRAFCGDATDG